MPFEVKEIKKEGVVHLHFSGHIDENSTFPIFNSLKGKVEIDLKDIKSINSVGIRAWIKWFSSFQGVNFVFLNCPKSIVMQMNMVEGFLPDHSSIESINVPFYCEDCDKEIEVLFSVGNEIIVEDGKVQLHYDKNSVCPKGCDPELDVNESKYFKFLLKSKANVKAA